MRWAYVVFKAVALCYKINFSLSVAKGVMDELHTGLDMVKSELEYIYSSVCDVISVFDWNKSQRQWIKYSFESGQSELLFFKTYYDSLRSAVSGDKSLFYKI